MIVSCGICEYHNVNIVVLVAMLYHCGNVGVLF